MNETNKIRLFYRFLLNHWETETPFTYANVAQATGWADKTARTYIGKQAKSVIRRGKGSDLYVKRNFVYLGEEEFVRRVSQKENILSSYSRTLYERVVIYEFLMPLTKEDTLRRTLDGLFYRDTLEALIRRVGLSKFHAVLTKRGDEDDSSYTKCVADTVSKLFTGYSISHVSGRFRADELMTQLEAVDKRYIIDETTAVVRFIIPCQCSKKKHGDSFDVSMSSQTDLQELEDEIKRIRTLFFSIFAEVVVHSVEGEDEIWLIETASNQQKVYVWEKT